MATDAMDDNTRCSRCGIAFRCGVSAGESACWCMTLPVLPPSRQTGAGCYCPACLRAALHDADAAGLDAFVGDPSPSRSPER